MAKIKTEYGAVSTADATPKAIWTQLIGSGSFWALVHAAVQPTGEFHTFTLQGVVGNSGEGAQVFSEEIAQTGSTGAPNVSVAFAANGQNVELQVTGIAATNIAWVAEVQWITVD